VPILWPAAITMITFLGVSWLAVTLRIFTRVLLISSFGADDIAMLVTLVFYSVYCGAAVTCSLIVSGHNSLTIHELTTSVQWLIVMEVFYIITMMTLKISIGIFFLRIAFRPWHRYIVYAAVGFSTVFSVAYFFFAIFQCGYFTSALIFFLRRVTDQCVSRVSNLALALTVGVITTLTDLSFAILPFAVLHRAAISKKEKVIVGFILTLAAVGCVASMVRLRYVEYLGETGYSFYATSTPLMVWSAIEAGLGITASSLATLRPLFQRFLNTTRSLRSRTILSDSNLLSQNKSKRSSSSGSIKLFRQTKNPVVSIDLANNV